MPLYKWSQTASANGTADGTINYAEGQAPASLNDSARAAMAATAMYRDDIAGAIVTGGTSAAYTIASFSVFDTLAHMNGQMIAFTPHITNTAGPVQLNVDGLGQKPLRSAPNVDLQAGVLIQGTPYTATYNNSDGAFYLQGFFGNPYNIPLAAGLDYWGPSAPSSVFAFPVGQAISRTAYAALFALIGTTYGVGDGSTTFNLPDKRGRVSATPDNMGGGDAARFSFTHTSMAAVRTTLGGAGGAATHTLTAAEIPTLTSSGNNAISVTSTVGDVVRGSVIQGSAAPSINLWNLNSTPTSGFITSTGNNTIIVTSSGTSGADHDVCQPTILCNYIIRVL